MYPYHRLPNINVRLYWSTVFVYVNSEGSLVNELFTKHWKKNGIHKLSRLGLIQHYQHFRFTNPFWLHRNRYTHDNEITCSVKTIKPKRSTRMYVICSLCMLFARYVCYLLVMYVICSLCFCFYTLYVFVYIYITSSYCNLRKNVSIRPFCVFVWIEAINLLIHLFIFTLACYW